MEELMKILSLKLREEIFKEVEKVVKKIHISRNAYINQALSYYNAVNRRKLLKNQLGRESSLVRASSLEILREFERMED